MRRAERDAAAMIGQFHVVRCGGWLGGMQTRHVKRLKAEGTGRCTASFGVTDIGFAGPAVRPRKVAVIVTRREVAHMAGRWGDIVTPRRPGARRAEPEQREYNGGNKRRLHVSHECHEPNHLSLTYRQSCCIPPPSGLD
ncbi:hypothetical protein [Celeribacter indicus]|uniref:hypothetical protein n=1 Tax=Celeribacter indicus TaxID=1208324 RepID=UPI0011147F7C|nr:hypothetical protein [Celeribacter indicus]